MTHLEKLYREVAPVVGLPVAEVERIFRFQCQVTYSEIGSGNYKMVRWPLLGAFSPLEYRLSQKLDREIKKNFHSFGFHAC